ncbi:SGNH/GDSL hydrolase family protein [Paenibacillus caseinilyticus]|uniref:SGNH/GDSL hydrolase family protein n=1 Tax=Paenibacillus caseinilyticus TaxID=3098138 RepID=UPI0022B8F27B|nr:SGNH/GDSL hydrolase family protein [Paenibacillus caseinilyticus]MCZ8521644.1 SGNH/GDSL hydrolase family protein [Paenibacillus caseinilyticus]
MRTVLFQGDSITDGGRGRSEDLNHILGHGYVYLIAAELGLRTPARAPHMINRGVSGNRAADLYARWEEDALLLQPDLISLLVGVNDAGAQVSRGRDGGPDRFGRTCRRLIEDTGEFLPDSTLVICEPFLLPAGRAALEWQVWDTQMKRKQEELRKLAEEYSLGYIPLQQSFTDACELAPAAFWLWDGIHPTAAGHALLKNRWLEYYDAQLVPGSGGSDEGRNPK